MGAGAKSDVVADLVTFSRAKGVYGGLNLDGTVVAPSNDWNNAYFKKDVLPPDILIRMTAHNKAADPLLSMVAKAAGKKQEETPTDATLTEAMELYIKEYPDDKQIPELLFRQGKLYYDYQVYDPAAMACCQVNVVRVSSTTSPAWSRASHTGTAAVPAPSATLNWCTPTCFATSSR